MWKKGFTLIELLVSAAIFGIISIAIYTTFAAGMQAIRRTKEVDIGEEKVLLRIEKLSRQLRQTFDFQEVGFYGDKDKLSFPEIIDSEITRISYFFDLAKKTIFYSYDSLADILAAKDKEEELASKPIPYLIDVDKISFSYFYFDLQKGAYLWKDQGQENILPLAVKLSITTRDESYAATIFIPTGY